MSLLDDTSGFAAGMFTFQDGGGAIGYTLVVRGTFDIEQDGALTVSQEQDPVLTGDVFSGEPGKSSVELESDLAWFKPGTDVVLIGSARAIYDMPVREMQVKLRIGSIEKRVDVLGDRYWSVFGISEPEPFTQMPLVYERAFGGIDENQGAFGKNPVGTGFKRKGGKLGEPLPNLENPSDRIRSQSDEPPPHGFGVISRNWEPRTRLSGTFDDKWQQEQLPLLPLDFSTEYFQAAPPDLVHRPYLEGGEGVEIAGVTSDGKLSFRLPKIAIGVAFHMRRSSPERRRAILDTVVLRPDQRKVNLVWRSSILCKRAFHDLRRAVSFRMQLETARRYWQVAMG